MKNTIAEKMLSLESKDDGSWVKTSINASFKKKKGSTPYHLFELGDDNILK